MYVHRQGRKGLEPRRVRESQNRMTEFSRAGLKGLECGGSNNSDRRLIGEGLSCVGRVCKG